MCNRVRCFKPRKGQKTPTLDDSNTTCSVHKQTPNAGVKEAHDMVMRLVPDAEVLGEVQLNTEGRKGRAFNTGQFVRGDGRIDLLVRGT